MHASAVCRFVARLLPACAVLSPGGAVLAGAAPLFEKADLFESGVDGYALYRIPGIVVTKKGTVLAYCEARKSGKGDWGAIDTMLRRSADGGRTWLPRQCIVHVEGDLPVNPVAAAQNLDKPGENTANNPVAIADRETGAVHFLYCLEYCRCFYMRSDDEGATWSEGVEITATFEEFRKDYDWKVIAVGPAHGIQLTHGPVKGRLVVPVWMSLGTGGHAHRPSVTATIYSDDHGRSWHRGEIAIADNAQYRYPNETVVVQLTDGRVMLNARSESDAHRRLQTTSPDGAGGWSRPAFNEELLEPICMGSIVRFSRKPENDKNRIVFANPHNLQRADGKAKEGVSRDRRNLSVKLSYDEGRTWPQSKAIESGYSAYSDLAVLADGTVLCFYERGREADGATGKPTSYAFLTLARFNLEWLTDGKDSPVLDQRSDFGATREHFEVGGPMGCAEPLLETTCVFPFAAGNKPNHRIPAVIQAPGGDVLAFAEKRNDGPGDVGDTDVVLKRSRDKGRTWSAEQVVLDDGERTCADITVGLDHRTKKIWLFFLRDKKEYAYLTSGDDGATWQGPVSIHEEVIDPAWERLVSARPERASPSSRSAAAVWARGWHQRYGVGPGNAMIQLREGPKAGRLVVPARHREDIGQGRLRSFSHVFFSDDRGATWKRGGTVGANTSECQLVELADGEVMVVARDESGEDAPGNLRHRVAVSRDGGETWGPVRRAEELITPRCHGAVERLDAARLLFSSPASNCRQEEHPYGRTNLVVRVSCDEGATWSGGRTVWQHPASYSDLAVLDDGTVALVYERGGAGSTHYWDEVAFVRASAEWLSGGLGLGGKGNRK